MKAPSSSIPNRLLRQARERACLSQEELAERLGIVQVTVSRWERGVTVPTPYYRRNLCALFGLTATELGLGPFPMHDSVADAGAHSESTAAGRIHEQDEMVPEPSSSVMMEPVFPPPSSSPRALIGRADIMSALRQRLCRSEAPVTQALYGMPGVGKTALAAALARDPEVLPHFPDGVLWAGLGRFPNLLGVLAAWGKKLGVSSSDMRHLSTVESWAKAICAAIGARRILIVIDDAWSIDDLLAFKVGGPHCCHLATTRFPTLALQFAGRDVTAIRELGEEDGLALLARQAPQVVASEHDDARVLVQSVGALPLALILLGGYLNIQAHAGQPRRLRAALERLRSSEERLRLAEARAPADTPPSLPNGASLSLHAMIAVSDEHLDARAQLVLRALSIFPPKPNSFPEAAALAVGATSTEALDTLVDAGLLEPCGPDRYVLHQTIADYARLDLKDIAAYERLAAFYVAYTEEHADTHAALDREVANIQTALQIAHGRALDALLVRGVNAFAPFLLARGFYDMAESYLHSARASACALGDEPALAHATFYLGRIAHLRGDLQAADTFYAESLSLARRAGERELLSRLLAFIGEIALIHGDFRCAASTLNEGLAVSRASGYRQQMGLLLRLLGQLAHCQGDFVREEACYQEGLALSREVGDIETTTELLQNLGAKAVKEQRYTEAEEFYAEGLALARGYGLKQRISALLSNLGCLALHHHDHMLAEHYLTESVQIARHLGQSLRLANALQNFGILEGARGDYQQAETYLRESIELARALPHPFLLSESLCACGEVQLAARQVAAASGTFSEALTIARRVDANEEEALALYGLARIALLRGDYVEAQRLGEASLEHLQAERHERTGEVARWLATLPQQQPHSERGVAQRGGALARRHRAAAAQ